MIKRLFLIVPYLSSCAVFAITLFVIDAVIKILELIRRWLEDIWQILAANMLKLWWGL
ncbi:MAG: hypothetical protein LBQ52_04520 [Helicobacteraceae bacterium]|nr:hypothetical protein [Helicobacteraceae bacterium]